MTDSQRLERIESLLEDMLQILEMQLNEKMDGAFAHARIRDEINAMFTKRYPPPKPGDLPSDLPGVRATVTRDPKYWPEKD